MRKSKENGYLTMPFDLGVTNIKGIVQCIRDDFDDFTNSKYLKLIEYDKELSPIKLAHLHPHETLLINTKYNFYFNHESPGHADLCESQNWAEGINHYVNKDWLHFKNRYNKRIQNFKNVLNDSNNKIMFLMEGYGINNKYVEELKHVLFEKYPSLNYEFYFYNVGDKKEYINILKMNYGLFINDEAFMNYLDDDDFV